jgi:3-oxoacyl-[acyl-carrier protein] reductase
MAGSERPLAGKVALVTGGSSGIGAASARMLAEAGAHVVVGYNSGHDRAMTLIAGLAGEGHHALPVQLEDSATAKAAAIEIGERYGRCDILVNSAGFTKPVRHKDLDALDDATFDAVLVANVRGPFAMIRALAPLLRKSDDGVVVNISSISAFTGSGSSIAYCAAKAGLDTMTIALARALAPEIRLLCVSPSAVATDFVAGRGRAAVAKLAEATPLKRITEAEDVARAVMACVTHLRNATGTRIVVDGGRSIM